MLTRYILLNLGPEESRFWQAYWAVLGLLAHAPKPCEIVIATDHPAYFAWLGDAIKVHALSGDNLAEWIGPQKYFFRTLIKALECALEAEPEADVVVYMDTDTVARRSLAPLIEGVREGRIFMDCREYNLYESGAGDNKGARRLWQEVGDRSWGGVLIDRSADMWNTGITAVGRRDAPLIRQALAICDEILQAGCVHRLTEQIALSAVLADKSRTLEVNPKGADPLVVHYWNNKRGWHEAITGHLATIHHRGLSVAEAVHYFLEHPVDRPVRIPKTRKWHRFLKVEPVFR